MSIVQIIEGTVNNILNKQEELFKERIEICRTCPLLLIGMFGEECNPGLWMNPNTLEISTKAKEGFIHGCGCILRSKTRVKDAVCPLKRW